MVRKKNCGPKKIQFVPEKKFSLKKIFWSENNFGQKKFGSTFFLNLKFSDFKEKLFWSKNLLDWNLFEAKLCFDKMFWSQNSLSKKIWLNFFFDLKFSDLKNLRANYFFGPRIIFGLKFSSSKNFFGAKTEIFLKQNFVLTKYLTHSLAWRNLLTFF